MLEQAECTKRRHPTKMIRRQGPLRTMSRAHFPAHPGWMPYPLPPSAFFTEPVQICLGRHHLIFMYGVACCAALLFAHANRQLKFFSVVSVRSNIAAREVRWVFNKEEQSQHTIYS